MWMGVQNVVSRKTEYPKLHNITHLSIRHRMHYDMTVSEDCITQRNLRMHKAHSSSSGSMKYSILLDLHYLWTLLTHVRNELAIHNLEVTVTDHNNRITT